MFPSSYVSVIHEMALREGEASIQQVAGVEKAMGLPDQRDKQRAWDVLQRSQQRQSHKFCALPVREAAEREHVLDRGSCT